MEERRQWAAGTDPAGLYRTRLRSADRSVRRCCLTIRHARRGCTVYFGELTFGHKDTGMSKMNPSELAKKIGAGLLSFPVTHFTREFQFDERTYREHISWLLEYKPAGLFAAGGTGH